VAGDLKLAYSQFSELESFAKFGTRLDESTQRIIDHGKRIRACFIQPESEPVPMSDQIVILLAISAGLFGPVPLEKVAEGVKALRGAAAKMSGEVVGRLNSAPKMSDPDKKVILDLAALALAPFRPAPPPPAPPKAPPPAPSKAPSKPGTASTPPAAEPPPATKAAVKPPK
jgi:F-type H+-transporting ATPase subunit alpha